MHSEYGSLTSRPKLVLPTPPAARDAVDLVGLLLNAPTPRAKFPKFAAIPQLLSRHPPGVDFRPTCASNSGSGT